MNTLDAYRHRREMLRVAFQRGDTRFLVERAQKVTELDPRSLLAVGLLAAHRQAGGLDGSRRR